MHHPFQKIAYISPAGNPFLLGASGSNLLSISLTNGTIASRWPSDRRFIPSGETKDKVEDAPLEPPNKRRKVEQIEEDSNIINITPTPDGRHAVVVTAEDKNLRVFSVSDEGRLEQLSQRCMTKRPSAITLIDHGRTIASADKFGDVYSLPLLPTAEEDAAAKEVFLQNAKSLRVMATETTVHSKANMKSLEFQRKQAKENKPAKIKDTMEFAHSFLLGHISMITDIVATELPTEKYGSKHRTHILTSDRDEHIRISRGPPQSFVTEGYCLGHKEYISKMCLITANLLISGGGDDDLLVWDIIKRSATSKISIRSAVIQANEKIEDDFRIAVSGLWLYPAHGENEAKLLVAVEGQPFLFHCPVSPLESGATLDFVPLPGNLLDVTTGDGFLLVSVDNIHTPGSTKIVDVSTDFKSRLQIISLFAGDEERIDHIRHQLVEANGTMTTEWHEKRLQTLLYSTETLRKLRDSEEVEGNED